MTPDDKLELALGLLDDPHLPLAERELAADPALADEIGRLRLALHNLLDDDEDDALEPPADLAQRTLRRVVETRQRRTILDFVPTRVPFRPADLAIAAGIFLATLATLLPAVQRSRDAMRNTACVANLQRLGQGLAQYAVLHGTYPYVPPDSPASRAGSFAVKLHDAGLLDDASVLDCPANGPAPMPPTLPDYDELCAMEAKAPASAPCLSQSDYAYHLGYRTPRESGALGPVPARLEATVPLLADKPPHDGTARILDGNSPNHHGSGQNVLFSDAHVGWLNTRRVSPLDHDLFLNERSRPAPGLFPHDAVLAPGIFRFDGN